jgi:hypothetical protein
MSKLLEALEESGVGFNMVQIGLGQDRGFVRILDSGTIEFHLVHIPDAELFPNQEDFIEFQPDQFDVNLFRVIADHMADKYKEIQAQEKQKPPAATEPIKKPASKVEPQVATKEGMAAWLEK